MSPIAHRIYIGTLTSIVVITAIFLTYYGMSYYLTPLEERFYHPQHAWYKPSGVFGHGLGIVGTLLILIGVFGYMAKKKYKFLARFGRLKYWLEFHIFLCSLGPLLVLFHTAFKFGGLVSVSFWSMVAVVASGVVGRFIYINIPRTIEGRELSLQEVKDMKANLDEVLAQNRVEESVRERIKARLSVIRPVGKGNFLAALFRKYMEDRRTLGELKQMLLEGQVQRGEVKEVLKLLRREITLNNRIARLQTMQKLFKYWHVAHLPFALIMLIIMVIHVVVTLLFGYKWIF